MSVPDRSSRRPAPHDGRPRPRPVPNHDQPAPIRLSRRRQSSASSAPAPLSPQQVECLHYFVARVLTPERLTAREQEVLRLTATAAPHAVIAEQLGISRKAVESCLGRIYGKLGVHGRADAVARARELGLLD